MDGDLTSFLAFARAIAESPCAWARPDLQAAFAARLQNGEDPLGDRYSLVRSSEQRRSIGAVLTPPRIVGAMLNWAKREAVTYGVPKRVVDPGAGTGRFTLAAAKMFPNATILAIENDPDLIVLLRANLKEAGLIQRVTVLSEDFRSIDLDEIVGPTLFIGNPPYVRHHQIAATWKRWYSETCLRHGVKASQLAGSHLHFFAKIAQVGRYGDYGCLITSAEWLDVGYGAALRSLLAGDLGGTEVHILESSAEAFPGTMTTAAITGFRVGRKSPYLRVRKIPSPSGLDRLEGGRRVDWETASKSPKWSVLIRPTTKPPTGTIELGELCRVHRGQVTGANRIWIASNQAADLPQTVLKPTITRAAELFAAQPSLNDDRQLARVIDLPVDLDEIEPQHRPGVEKFIAWARLEGGADGYIARHRSPWWAVRLAEPAPIVCTYMARRAPAFVRNHAKARLLNIAHGIYPREALPDAALSRLVAALRGGVSRDQGRTYSGGLTKFEPREIERIPIVWPG